MTVIADPNIDEEETAEVSLAYRTPKTGQLLVTRDNLIIMYMSYAYSGRSLQQASAAEAQGGLAFA